MTKATAASITPKATKEALKTRESPELHRSPAPMERLLGAAAAGYHLSQGLPGSRSQRFPYSKVPPPSNSLLVPLELPHSGS